MIYNLHKHVLSSVLLLSVSLNHCVYLKLRASSLYLDREQVHLLDTHMSLHVVEFCSSPECTNQTWSLLRHILWF